MKGFIVLLLASSALSLPQFPPEGLTPPFARNLQPPPFAFSSFLPVNSSCYFNSPSYNKELVKKAYQISFGDKNVQALSEYFSENLINHNPKSSNGLNFLRNMLKNAPWEPFTVDIKRIAADGDLVWTHAALPASVLGSVYAAADIFRIKCGKIVEHWDVLEDTKTSSNNPHPFF